jgi:NAD(P)-dependent dehydrogenase (short-subunit alcohol dehydrogenase family)
MEIEERAALVTRGAHGIGRAVALGLAMEGAAVVVADIDRAEGESERLHNQGCRPRRVIRRGRRQEWRRRQGDDRSCRRRVRRLDILVNNAGGYEEPVYPKEPVAHWTRTLDLHLRSAVLAIQHAVRALRRAGRCDRQHRFLGGPRPGTPLGPEYAAAKAALLPLTACLPPLAQAVRRR